VDEHARFGGIIPEIASRAHLEAMVPTIERALSTAGVTLADVDAVAVTAGPGLVGPLTVGASAAKALAVGLGKPLYGINHVIGHAVVDELVDGPFPERVMALVVSGGHSSLLLLDDTVNVTELGSTLDDAAGEAFDKVGRLLGLPYPGGPHIDRLAREGDPDAIRFPRGLTAPKDQAAHATDFSFSGLKTAVARWVEARQDAGLDIPLNDVAASFAAAAADSGGDRLALLSSRTGDLLRWLTPQPEAATDGVLSVRDGWVYFVSYPIDLRSPSGSPGPAIWRVRVTGGRGPAGPGRGQRLRRQPGRPGGRLRDERGSRGHRRGRGAEPGHREADSSQGTYVLARPAVAEIPMGR